MSQLNKVITALIQDEDGQGMVEYALVLALVSVVAIGTLTMLGGNLNGVFNKAATTLKVN